MTHPRDSQDKRKLCHYNWCRTYIIDININHDVF
uniref:Uncharacterized protein n=1 Tax=Anguilla anguilla TaxID=7936 RepID=A0A0E9T7Q7_ANGAN